MKSKIISASSYSNTAPLIWSFLYGSRHGKYELILDTAPSRSAELLAGGRVEAALVPVIAAQTVEGVRIIPDVCIGATDKVRSVCFVTKSKDLADVKSVSLDISSKTSVVLTKIIFREFLGFEPEWYKAEPDLAAMLSRSDCALLIGDPALMINQPGYRVFDLVEIWRKFTGLGFVFAMWMTRNESCDIDFAAARDEGLNHLNEIISSYESEIPLSPADFKTYLSGNISYCVEPSMKTGMDLFFDLACKNKLIEKNRPLNFT